MSWCELLLVTVSQTQGLWEKHIKALQQDPMHDSIDLRLVDSVFTHIYWFDLAFPLVLLS